MFSPVQCNIQKGNECGYRRMKEVILAGLRTFAPIATAHPYSARKFSDFLCHLPNSHNSPLTENLSISQSTELSQVE